MKCCTWVFFEIFIKKTQASLKSDKNNRYFTWQHINLWYLMELFLEWEMFGTKVVEKIRTFSQKLSHLWDVEKCGRVREATDDNVIWRMRFACCTTRATGIHSEYEILLFHGNNGFVKQLVLFVHTLPVFFFIFGF